LGPLAAQVVHAAGESSPGNLPTGTIAVVLGVPDEKALIAISARLTLAGIAHKRIFEDAEPYKHQLMAIGCAPGRKEVVGRVLRGLKLLK
jgi:hypothetical protein